MLRRALLILFAVVLCLPVQAQQDTAIATPPVQSHLRISLLTCSPGEEIYETFGHSAIRIIDSTKTGKARDVVYNFGFLDSSPDNTVMHQFLTDRVHVYLATNTIVQFNYQYGEQKRGVEEMVFLLSSEDKAKILAYLENNCRRENRYYEYSSAYDNCCTRILGIFTHVFGDRFVPAQVLPKGVTLRFRQFTDRCGPQTIQHKYWFSTGMKILFGLGADRIPTNMEAMYIADYLQDGMEGATVDGKKLCDKKTVLFENRVQWPDVPNEPVIVFWTLAIVTILGLVVKRLRILGNIMSTVVLFMTGILGCYIIYVWSIDAEPGWKDNFNVLWALPANLIIPFCGSKIKARYSLAALFLIFVVFVVDLLKVQLIPLSEITPLLLALVFVHGVMYRKAISKTDRLAAA